MSSKYERFVRTVWSHYEKYGRHTLPWRKTRNPYYILVSEVMLQQTQVERVLPYYKAWRKAFPRVEALANAPLSRVLTLWQGLGYNRRAKLLHETAKAVVQQGWPKDADELERLPGIGPYTARAVCAFAYNQDVVCIETNIRTAVMHHFFPNRKHVHDRDIARVLKEVLPKGKSRLWYSALMDYGAHLKRNGVRLNAKTKGYTKQTTFKGSDREVRGAIIRQLTQSTATIHTLQKLFEKKRHMQVRTQINNLLREGMIEKQARIYQLVQ